MYMANPVLESLIHNALSIQKAGFYGFKHQSSRNNMKKNIGTIDSLIRILIAAFILILYTCNFISGILGIVLLIFGGILVLTSLSNFCPLYIAFGISTSNKNE